MKYMNFLGLMLGLGLLTGCRPDRTTDDPEKLKQVLINYFDGIKDKDHKKMLESTTDDFIAYEEGKVYNNDSVFRDMDQISPYKAAFEFNNFKMQIDSKSGHMHYYEHAEFIVRDKVKFDLRFLGSAAFRKEDGIWKMSFLHSTKKYVPKRTAKDLKK